MRGNKEDMNYKKAIVIANNTTEGISVIDIDIYSEDGRKYCRPSKRLIDSINALPLLDKEKIKDVVSRNFDVPIKNITFH